MCVCVFIALPRCPSSERASAARRQRTRVRFCVGVGRVASTQSRRRNTTTSGPLKAGHGAPPLAGSTFAVRVRVWFVAARRGDEFNEQTHKATTNDVSLGGTCFAASAVAPRRPGFRRARSARAPPAVWRAHPKRRNSRGRRKSSRSRRATVRRVVAATTRRARTDDSCSGKQTPPACSTVSFVRVRMNEPSSPLAHTQALHGDHALSVQSSAHAARLHDTLFESAPTHAAQPHVAATLTERVCVVAPSPHV